MCGIIGYIGHRPASPLLMQGLIDLRYRGYDSAGVAIIERGMLRVLKAEGDPLALQPLVENMKSAGTLGIAHNRWATHGKPTDINAHPHVSSDHSVAVVHNGIIENYRKLRRDLESDEGGRYIFASETDTEVLAHLIHRQLRVARDKTLQDAVYNALLFVEGAYAIAVTCTDFPDVLVGARNSSPLHVGIDHGKEFFLASDEVAIARHVRHQIPMVDGDVVTLYRDGRSPEFRDQPPEELDKRVERVSISPEDIELGNFAHHMHKEILEQPYAIRETLRGKIDARHERVTLGCFRDERVIGHARTCERIVIGAAGTSFYSGLVGKLILEQQTGLPTEVRLSSEWGEPVMNGRELFMFISQSGTTADTLDAMRQVKERKGFCLGITNRVSSTLARENDGGVYLHAGPEQAVASTKAFTAQVVALSLMAASIAQVRGKKHERFLPLLQGLAALPETLEKVLECEAQIKELAIEYRGAKRIICLGRGFSEPLAYEGALKLKEIPYFDAHGLAGGELKHGTLALIEKGIPVIAVVRKDSQRDKMLSNMEEVKSRGGDLIAITTKGDDSAHHVAKHVIPLPDLCEELSSVVAAPVFQLLSYYLGLERGSNVDQPRNLAKSVTVR